MNFFGYFAVYCIGLIFQFSLAKYLSIFGLFPNIILLMLLYIGLKKGSMTGQIMGFAWGISWDVLSVGLFGSHSFLYACVGFFSGKLSRKWDESKVVTQVVIAGIASAIFLLGKDFIYSIFGDIDFGGGINYISVFQIFYNMLLVPFIFKIGEKFNRKKAVKKYL